MNIFVMEGPVFQKELFNRGFKNADTDDGLVIINLQVISFSLKWLQVWVSFLGQTIFFLFIN